MSVAWWIGLGVVVAGSAVTGGLVFARHRVHPIGTTTHGTALVPGAGRRVGSAVLLALLSIGLAGLAAAAIGSVVFLGGLSLAN